MSTAGKLWLGFGLLLALLIGTGLFVAHRLASIEQALLTIMAVKEPATAVTYEMAANVLKTRSAVIGYVETGDTTYREQVAGNHAKFAVMKFRYDRVTLSPASRQLGLQIGQAHASFRALGDSLIGLGDRLRLGVADFGRASQALEGLLATELRGQVGSGRDGQRKLASATMLEAQVAGIGAAVGRYLLNHAPVHRVRVAELEDRFRTSLEQFTSLKLDDQQRAITARVSKRFGNFADAGRDVMALSDATRERADRFGRLGSQVEQLVGEGIRSLARIDLIEAHRSARVAIRTSLIAVLVLLVAGIVIGGSTALPTARSIVHTDQALRDRNAALALADRRKDEFLGVLGHELRNPLAPLGNALAVLDTYDRQVPEPVRRTHTMMKRQVRHITRLVDDLLDVNRIHYGKIALQRRPIELSSVVCDVVEDMSPMMAEHRHVLEVALPTEPAWVDADPTRLAQIVANLLNNAARYTPDGGRISVSVTWSVDEAALCVEDNGMGIAPDHLDRIFEPFAQADEAPMGPQGGLGIGLTLVERLVDLHGGQVDVQSDGPGLGSRFRVRFPRVPEGVAPGRSTDATSPAPLDGSATAPSEVSRLAGSPAAPPRHILVVDDNRDSADTLAALLTLWGHDVRIAYDGPTAIRAAAGARPDLVLLDIHLPGMDGYEVARRLRSETASTMRLVALTGFGLPKDVSRSRMAGFDRHLTKPVSPETLQALLAETVGGSSQGSEGPVLGA